MTKFWRVQALAFLLVLVGAASSSAVELKVNRDVLERTLRQQLFSGPEGRYYLKGNAQTPCSVYAEDAHLNFAGDRVVVVIKTHAKLGKSFGSSCLGITLTSAPEVSLAPVGEGEVIGFRDARFDKILNQKELNFILAPFLSRQLPASMQVNAADLLRKALVGSTATSGYKVSLDRLKIHSMQVDGETLVLDVDGDLSVK